MDWLGSAGYDNLFSGFGETKYTVGTSILFSINISCEEDRLNG